MKNAAEGAWWWSGGGLTWIAQSRYSTPLTKLAIALSVRLPALCKDGAGTANARRVPEGDCVSPWKPMIYVINFCCR